MTELNNKKLEDINEMYSLWIGPAVFNKEINSLVYYVYNEVTGVTEFETTQYGHAIMAGISLIKQLEAARDGLSSLESLNEIPTSEDIEAFLDYQEDGDKPH